MEFPLTCPHCGGSIQAQIDLKSDSTGGSNPAQIPTVEPVAPDLSKGFRSYNRGYEQEFLQFWDVYPLHRGKRKAQVAWLKSVSRLAQIRGSNRVEAMAQILAGAKRYRDDPNRLPEFTKYAEGWLNGERWEDDPIPGSTNGRGPESAAMRILRETGGVG